MTLPLYKRITLDKLSCNMGFLSPVIPPGILFWLGVSSDAFLESSALVSASVFASAPGRDTSNSVSTFAIPILLF